jgi:hypothetical protein
MGHYACVRLSKWIGGVAVAAGLVVGSSSIPAWAGGRPGLPWRSPAKVTSGVSVQVASVARCPAVPTPGDSVLVQINLSFGPGGGSGQLLAANPDGSWSGTVTFFFSGLNVRHTTISAECLDFNGITGVPYAQYLVRRTQIFD